LRVEALANDLVHLERFEIAPIDDAVDDHARKVNYGICGPLRVQFIQDGVVLCSEVPHHSTLDISAIDAQLPHNFIGAFLHDRQIVALVIVLQDILPPQLGVLLEEIVLLELLHDEQLTLVVDSPVFVVLPTVGPVVEAVSVRTARTVLGRVGYAEIHYG
jgi:hypothetical protein